MPDSLHPDPRPAPHLAPAIVAALLWLALCLYLLLVIGKLFNLENFLSKPEQLQRSSPEVERWFVEFQRAHGTFWSALFGFAGCFQAALRRSTRIANVMIVLGCMAIGALIWVTLKHAGA